MSGPADTLFQHTTTVPLKSSWRAGRRTMKRVVNGAVPVASNDQRPSKRHVQHVVQARRE
jgi:hypothetical protein